MLTLIVFFPSQFVAHSPDLDQTVIDKYCKLQNLFQHAQHASSVCFIGKFQKVYLKKKKNSQKELCSICAGGCLTRFALLWDQPSNYCILFTVWPDQVSLTSSVAICWQAVWFKDFSVCGMIPVLCGVLLIELFPKECSRCYKTARGWVL